MSSRERPTYLPWCSTSLIKNGWVPGYAMTFIMEGTGNRTAHSFEGKAAAAAKLCITYAIGGGSATTDFAILSTTDEHGKCWDTNVLTGSAVTNSLLKVSAAVDSIRDTYGDDNVLVIDNGDLYQGTPVASYQILQLAQYLSSGSTAGLNSNLLDNGSFRTVNPMALCLKYIGYDAAVLGNHELNFGWNAMSSIYNYLQNDNATYGAVPVLAANLYWDGSDGVHTAGTNAFTPWISKEITVGGETFKIGILGSREHG